MESAAIISLLEQLDDDIDDLEDSLTPLMENALSTTSSKLPLLDKVKLYILVTYAIESMLFSYLRLNGVKAREHPVFKELTRVKQYFNKIKAAEAPCTDRPIASLDKKATARFIIAGLTGNEEHDSKPANSKTARRHGEELDRSHTKFEDSSTKAEKTTSGQSASTNRFGYSGPDLGNARTGLSRVLNASKKRKADIVDDSVLPSSISYSNSNSEPPSEKRRKSKE